MSIYCFVIVLSRITGRWWGQVAPSLFKIPNKIVCGKSCKTLFLNLLHIPKMYKVVVKRKKKNKNPKIFGHFNPPAVFTLWTSKNPFQCEQSWHFHQINRFTKSEAGFNKAKVAKLGSNAVVPVWAGPNKFMSLHLWCQIMVIVYHLMLHVYCLQGRCSRLLQECSLNVQSTNICWKPYWNGLAQFQPSTPRVQRLFSKFDDPDL